jgi:uncharacterized OsmC-like protein
LSTTPDKHAAAAPARQWSIQVICPAAGALQVRRAGALLDLNHIGPGQVTPVELLLVAIATCFALSCQAAFALRQQQSTAFEVEVRGSKAAQLPSRLAEVRLEVRFAAGLPAEEAQRIAALGKQMCTVTNTMTAAPACVVDVTVL